jgi:hypothetical protein
MPEKRKKDISGGKSSKKAKLAGDDKDFTSYMLSNYASDVSDLVKSGAKSDSSDDDSDAEGGAFPAFDLPSFGTFDDGDDVEPADSKEQENAQGSSGATGQSSTNNNGIIFLSDPSQLPQPISFTTPTLMSPVVIGKNSQTTTGQVIVMNSPVSSGSSKLVSHVQPVVLPAAQAKNSPSFRVAPRHTSTPIAKPGIRSFNTPTPTTVTTPQQRQQAQNLRQTRSAMNVAKPTSQSIASLGSSSNMSATNIMQQVMAAAQQAAKNLRAANAPVRPVMQPVRGGMHMPQQRMPLQQRPQFRNVRPGQNPRANFMPLPRGQIGRQVRGQTIGQVRPVVNGNARNAGVRQQFQPGTVNNNSMESVKKWKPYSDILNGISRRLTKDSGRKLGINPQMQLNLKQMYTLLRRKFNTNQIYDMCLWDMEHPDASLLEIAITNAFN